MFLATYSPLKEKDEIYNSQASQRKVSVLYKSKWKGAKKIRIRSPLRYITEKAVCIFSFFLFFLMLNDGHCSQINGRGQGRPLDTLVLLLLQLYGQSIYPECLFHGSSQAVRVYGPIAQCFYKRDSCSVTGLACPVIEANLSYPCEIKSCCL